jgi:hypothetical protein
LVGWLVGFTLACGRLPCLLAGGPCAWLVFTFSLSHAPSPPPPSLRLFNLVAWAIFIFSFVLSDPPMIYTPYFTLA